jgi:hypothetical protein
VRCDCSQGLSSNARNASAAPAEVRELRRLLEESGVAATARRVTLEGAG